MWGTEYQGQNKRCPTCRSCFACAANFRQMCPSLNAHPVSMASVRSNKLFFLLGAEHISTVKLIPFTPALQWTPACPACPRHHQVIAFRVSGSNSTHPAQQARRQNTFVWTSETLCDEWRNSVVVVVEKPGGNEVQSHRQGSGRNLTAATARRSSGPRGSADTRD